MLQSTNLLLTVTRQIPQIHGSDAALREQAQCFQLVEGMAPTFGPVGSPFAPRGDVPRTTSQPDRRIHRAAEDVSTCLGLMITNSGTQVVTSGVTISPLLPKVTRLTSEVGVDHTQLVPGYAVMRLVETHRPWPESCTDPRRCVFSAQPLNLE